MAFLLNTVLGGLSLLCQGQEAAPEVIQLRCREQADLRGTSIQIRDLAEITAADMEVAIRVGEIELANRPAFGISRSYRRQDIARRLMAAGLDLEQFDVSGPAEILVQPLTTVLRSENVVEVADPILRAALELESTEVEYEMTSRIRPLQVPPGRISLELIGKIKAVRPSSATVDVSIMVDGEEFQKVGVQYRLTRYVDTLVTTAAVRRGAPLDASNLEVRRMISPPGSQLFVTSFDTVKARVAAMQIPAGKPLQVAHLADPVVVFAKQLVKLRFQRGKVVLESQTEALQNGSIGDRITIRHPRTGKISWATVAQPGLVVIR